MNALPPFERVVAAHGSRVLRVCRAVVGPDDADDAWSETFLAALRAYPTLPASANVEAWLVTIAHRKAIDVVRARNRRALPAGSPVDVESWGPASSSDDDLAQRLDDATIWTQVAELPDKQRQVIAFHYLGGLPFPQVAELVGGSAAAARRAASDGMRTLRSRLVDPPRSEESV